MVHSLQQGRALWLGLGVFVGVALSSLLPHAPLHASATDRQENFAMATGRVDESVEAVFTLDFLTGQLNAAVLNPQTRQFSLSYSRNIMSDLKVQQGQNPKYLMVTGDVELRGGAAAPMGACAVYVAELTTGNMGAYALEFTRAWLNTPGAAQKQFVPLQVVQFRGAAVRGQ